VVYASLSCSIQEVNCLEAKERARSWVRSLLFLQGSKTKGALEFSVANKMMKMLSSIKEELKDTKPVMFCEMS
jgi:hypothetical protein